MIYRLALIALWGVAQTLAQNGCMDPLDANYNPGAVSDDGTSCTEYCWEQPGEGERLETELMPRWITGEVDQTDLHLLIQANQKYPITWVSLMSPETVDDANPTKRFESEFIEHGRVANTPGSAWAQTYALQQCWNDYEFVADWFEAYLPDDLQLSSLVRQDLPGVVMFTGFVEVRSYEDIEDIRDVNLTRWVTSVMKFDILFYTTVAITSGEINVLDEYNVMFAIVEQKTIIIDPAANPPSWEADVVLFTTIQWPFELQNPSIAVNDAQLGVEIGLHEDCEDPGVTQGAQAMDSGVPACNRRFHIDVSTLPGKCDFTADYTATFDVVCAASVDPQNCPLLGGETTSVIFNLESENVCPTIVEEVHSIAYSQTYKSARVGTDLYDAAELADAFMVMQRAFFEVGVNVVDHDDDLIEQTIITKIALCLDVACGTPIDLYQQNADPTPDAYFEPNIMLMIDNYAADPTTPLPTFSDFSFLLHPSVFPVPVDSSLTFHLVIDLDVTYQHTAELLEGAEAEQKQKAMHKAGKTVQKYVRNIRLGSDALRKQESLEHEKEQESVSHKRFLPKRVRMMQEGAENHMTTTATAEVITSEYPDAATKDPAINADGDLIHRADADAATPSSSALRRASTSGFYTRVLLSCVFAVLMTALAL